MKSFPGSVLSEKVSDYVAPKEVSSGSEASEPEANSSEESEGDIEDSENDFEETDGEHSEDESEENDSTTLPKGNAGWADAISKVLKTNKPKKKKTIVLSRAKTIQAAKLVKKDKIDYGFEIKGEIKEEKPVVEEIQDTKLTKVPIVRRKEWEARGRVKPTAQDEDREKILSKIAIKGVVQLFNAVHKHQNEVEGKLKDVGPSEIKRERVLKSIDKRAFLDVLMGDAKSEEVDSTVKSKALKKLKKEEPKSSWNVLREDFLTDTSLKDWDKKEDTINEENMDQESLSGSEDESS